MKLTKKQSKAVQQIITFYQKDVIDKLSKIRDYLEDDADYAKCYILPDLESYIQNNLYTVIRSATLQPDCCPSKIESAVKILTLAEKECLESTLNLD
jgi:hypothetical protein